MKANLISKKESPGFWYESYPDLTSVTMIGLKKIDRFPIALLTTIYQLQSRTEIPLNYVLI